MRAILTYHSIDESASPALHAAGEEAYHTLRDLVAAGLDDGELRGGDPDLVSLSCWSMVHGLSALLSSGAVPAPPTAAAQAELARALIGLLGQGIAARELRPPRA